MTPVITDNQQNQQFQAFIDGERAYLEYRIHDNILVLMHTEVPEKLGGHGLGSALIIYAFNYARERRYKVKVYCPFVASWLEKHPEQMDIVIPQSEGKRQV